jgi:hypothetical protein
MPAVSAALLMHLTEKYPFFAWDMVILLFVSQHTVTKTLKKKKIFKV